MDNSSLLNASGLNFYLVLGSSFALDANVTALAKLTAFTSVLSFAVGQQHAAVVAGNGSVYLSGSNNIG